MLKAVLLFPLETHFIFLKIWRVCSSFVFKILFIVFKILLLREREPSESRGRGRGRKRLPAEQGAESSRNSHFGEILVLLLEGGVCFQEHLVWPGQVCHKSTVRICTVINAHR